ncbi:MAG TPA: TonB-dependent receptor [Leeuwenhoekiella sp.]|nr:TonB-dependent receptor [Leeuwenhoekiella sp.]
MKIKFLLAILLACSSIAFSQSSDLDNYKITGKVVDNESGEPLEYATISVTNVDDPSDITGGITDPTGKFDVTVPEGNYDIKVEYISFSPKNFNNQEITKNFNLGTVSLAFATNSLNEVTVVAQKTTVDVRLDKKIYNIGQDLTTAGGTVSDALNNVPSVSVDVEGAISLRGNENVRILINGKPSAMAGFGGTDVLGQLPANAIERVEVITSPSARYDAEGTGGILNIILRKKETLGFNGSLNLNAGIPERYGVTGNINYRTDKFNLFNTTGYNYRDSPGNAHFDTRYFTSDDFTPRFNRVTEDRDYNRLNRGFNTNLGMEYYLTESSSLTGTVFFRHENDADLTLNNTDKYQDGDLVQQTVRRENERQDEDTYQFSLNYTNNIDEDGQKLTADFQYEYQDEQSPSFITETATFDETEEGSTFLPSEDVSNQETQNEFLIQSDYVLPLGEDSQFEAGYRGNFEEEVTDYSLDVQDSISGQLQRDPYVSNKFTYNENVNALYTQYGSKFGSFSFLLGLRLENTQLKGVIDSRFSDEELTDYYGIPINTDFDRNYLGLFPTVNIIYEIAEEQNITLGYNRRINRPRGWFINPFPSRSSRTNVFQGNPNLNPAYSNAFDLGYLNRFEKLTLNASVYYQHETNSFERVQEPSGKFFNEIEIIRTIPINLSSNDRIGAELGLLYNPADWLRLNGSFNYFQFKTEGFFEGTDYGATNNSYFARFSSKVSLPFKIDWQTNAYYRGPSENAQTKTDGRYGVDLAFSKEIFNDNATISLNVQDLFNSQKRNATTITDRFIQDSEFQWRQRQATVSFIYRFNQQKRDQQRRNDENQGNGQDDNDIQG